MGVGNEAQTSLQLQKFDDRCPKRIRSFVVTLNKHYSSRSRSHQLLRTQNMKRITFKEVTDFKSKDDVAFASMNEGRGRQMGYSRERQLLAKVDLPETLPRSRATEPMKRQTPRLKESRMRRQLNTTLDGFMPNQELEFTPRAGDQDLKRSRSAEHTQTKRLAGLPSHSLINSESSQTSFISEPRPKPFHPIT